jgi:enamine deaminase RidA (YjgF/YER057c/UK114 family)
MDSTASTTPGTALSRSRPAPARQAIPFDGPAPVPISSAVRWHDTLFLSGIAPLDLATGLPWGDGIAEQAQHALSTLSDTLAAAATDLAHVLRVTCFLADPADFGEWNTAFARFFPAEPPARTTVVAGFVVPGLRIEIEAIAGIPAQTAP